MEPAYSYERVLWMLRRYRGFWVEAMADHGIEEELLSSISISVAGKMIADIAETGANG